jgi:hemolysin D
MMALMLRDAHQFKPVLAEIESDPGSPLGPLMFWIVIVLLTLMVAWLCIGTIDIVVTTRGRVIPQTKQKLVQPLETGVVKSIFVVEGQHVKKGQLLMEIDPGSTTPDLESAQQNLAYAETESNRIQSQLANQAYTGGSATQEALYDTQRAELQGRLASKEQELAQVADQLAEAMADEATSADLLKVVASKRARLEPVQDLVPKNEWDQVEKDYLTYTKNLTSARNKQAELRHRRQQLDVDKTTIEREMQTKLLSQLADTEKHIIDYSSKEKLVTFRQTKQQIKSPVDGTIDQLIIHTVGGVVTPAQKLMSLVPDDTKLVIESQVKNQDIGYVHEGLPVTIKLDTFNYQKYGTLPGTLIHVSPDSRNPDNQPIAAEPADSLNDPQKKEKEAMAQPYYTVYIRPEKKSLMVDGKDTPISVGMTVTGEVIVGRRRIIEFFIYPIIKSFQDSVKLR